MLEALAISHGQSAKKRHAFWETQPVAQFDPAEEEEAGVGLPNPWARVISTAPGHVALVWA